MLPLCSNVQMRGSDRRDMPGGHSPSSDSTEEREGAFDYSKACFVHTYTIVINLLSPTRCGVCY